MHIVKPYKHIDRDSLAIRNGLTELIERAPAGGTFHDAVVEVQNRNSFCIRLDEGGPIFTVTVSYGGSLRSKP